MENQTITMKILREENLKSMRNKQFFKPIIVSIDDMDRFEKKKMKKIRPVKNTWFDWLINYIPDPIKKSLGGFKDKILNIFKANTPKKAVYGRGKKLSKPGKQNVKKPFTSEENKEKIEDRIIRDIWKIFETEKEKEGKRESEKKKKQNKILI